MENKFMLERMLQRTAQLYKEQHAEILQQRKLYALGAEPIDVDIPGNIEPEPALSGLQSVRTPTLQ